MTGNAHARGVVVTGGFGALGTSVARAFAGAGDKVVLIDHSTLCPPGVDVDAAIVGVDLTLPAEADRALTKRRGGWVGSMSSSLRPAPMPGS